MQIEMFGHACFMCETQDCRILMDPWISGPSNFRSWWHIPSVRHSVAQVVEAANYIYISHLHNDHFHPESLGQIERKPAVLIPRLYHNRLRQRLQRLGFRKIIELPHAKVVSVSPQTFVQCLQAGNDSMLAVRDTSAAMLNANDCLQGSNPAVTIPMLRGLAEQYKFDIAFLAFGTAGPFPKCYHFEDPKDGLDPQLKEKAMLSNFVQGARAIRAKSTVPFAGGFALLASKLMWMNNVKSTPRDALDALKSKDEALHGFEMNPGDRWDSHDGLVQVHPTIDWNNRLTMIHRLRDENIMLLDRIEAEERQGPANLYDLFQARLTQNLRSFPWLKRQMKCSVLFEVEGNPGGQWEVDFRAGACRFRHGDSGDWLMRLAIPSSLLASVLTDPDGWETLGISYKLDLTVRKGALAKEGLLDRLIYTPTPFKFARLLLAPRFADFVFRRRSEFVKLCAQKLHPSA